MSDLNMGERLQKLRTLLPNGSEMTNIREQKLKQRTIVRVLYVVLTGRMHSLQLRSLHPHSSAVLNKHVSSFCASAKCKLVTIQLYIDEIGDLSQQDGWKTGDGRMTKKRRARLCIPILPRHFFIILPS